MTTTIRCVSHSTPCTSHQNTTAHPDMHRAKPQATSPQVTVCLPYTTVDKETGHSTSHELKLQVSDSVRFRSSRVGFSVADTPPGTRRQAVPSAILGLFIEWRPSPTCFEIDVVLLKLGTQEPYFQSTFRLATPLTPSKYTFTLVNPATFTSYINNSSTANITFVEQQVTIGSRLRVEVF